MRYIALPLVTLMVSGCLFATSGRGAIGHGGKVRFIAHHFWSSHFTELEYWSPEALAAEDRQNPQSDPEDGEANNKAILPQGSLRVNLLRRELDHANPKHYRVVIRAANRELMRVYGEHALPQWRDGYWRGFIAISLPPNVPESFQVQVIDPSCYEQNVYEITRDEDQEDGRH